MGDAAVAANRPHARTSVAKDTVGRGPYGARAGWPTVLKEGEEGFPGGYCRCSEPYGADGSGIAEVDISELMNVQGGKGKAVRILHWLKDELWSLGAPGPKAPEALDVDLGLERDGQDEDLRDGQEEDLQDGGVPLEEGVENLGLSDEKNIEEEALTADEVNEPEKEEPPASLPVKGQPFIPPHLYCNSDSIMRHRQRFPKCAPLQPSRDLTLP